MTRRFPVYSYVLIPSLIAALLLSPSPTSAEDRQVFTIGVLIDGESERTMTLLDLLKTEIDVLTRTEYDLRLPKEKTIIADWTRAGVEIGMGQLLADDDVDLVLAVGAIAADVAAARAVFSKPVITPLAIDAQVQGFPFDSAGGGSGVVNFTYANILAPTNRDIQTFLEIHQFSKLAVIIQPALAEAMPTLPATALAPLAELNVEAILVTARATPAETVAAIPDEAEAAYVLPLMRFDLDDIEELAEGLTGGAQCPEDTSRRKCR